VIDAFDLNQVVLCGGPRFHGVRFVLAESTA
jgi:hypothetical protein